MRYSIDDIDVVYRKISKEYNILKDSDLPLYSIYRTIQGKTNMDLTDIEACVRVLRNVGLPKNFPRFSSLFEPRFEEYKKAVREKDVLAKRQIFNHIAEYMSASPSTVSFLIKVYCFNTISASQVIEKTPGDEDAKEKTAQIQAEVLDNQPSNNEEVLKKEDDFYGKNFSVSCALPKSRYEQFVDRIRNLFKK
jgi:hypothetical protein